MSIHSKMTAIANEIRTLSDTTDIMGLDAMSSNVSKANTEVSTQTGLISLILGAIEDEIEKISSIYKVTIVTDEFAHTMNSSDTGTYDFTLTSESLKSSVRRAIIVFVKNDTEYSEVWKVLYRSDLNGSFIDHLGSETYIRHGVSTTVSENSIEIASASIASDTFTKFWFVAV